VNYNHFLNKSNKFKNKNRYRLESKKKNSYVFLLISFVSIALLSTVFILQIDTEQSVNQISKQTTADIELPTQSQSTSSHKKNIPLELPEISYHTEILSQSISYVEVESSTNKESLTNKEPSANKQPSVPVTPVTKTATIKTAIIDTIPDSISKQQITNDATISILEKVDVIAAESSQDLTSNLPAKTEITKTVVVKSGDTLSAIFKRLSLSANTLHKIIRSSKQAKQLTRIKPGQKIIITFNSNNEFQSLRYDLDRIDTLIINKETDTKNFVSHIESKEIEVQQQFAAGIITNSLFASGNKAGLSSAMIMQLAQLFGWDIDFALDIRKGDSFAVLFEEKYINGKKIGNGNILSAEFVNRGKTFKAIRYTDASGHTDYYSEKGLSMRKAFLRTPVAFSRISSRFSSGRKHPVLNRIRAHKGVDYAASRGTPIKAVGNGKVIFKGRKGGYGRVIILQHGSKYTTLYAHMKSYKRNIKKGSRVEQGQIIGYVGSSGLATGPHLHYEFRINGVHRNPLTVPLPSASPIAKKYRTDFKNTADTMISQLKSRKQETIALTEQ